MSVGFSNRPGWVQRCVDGGGCFSTFCSACSGPFQSGWLRMSSLCFLSMLEFSRLVWVDFCACLAGSHVGVGPVIVVVQALCVMVVTLMSVAFENLSMMSADAMK